MATIERTRGGFPMGWLCAIALGLAAMVLAPLARMPAMMTESAEQTKAPADMSDKELRAEIDATEVEVVDTLERDWDEPASQEAFAAELAATEAQSERYVAANEEATRRGWYSFAYTDAELTGIAATKMIVLDLPGEGATEVAIGHIATGHGTEAVQAVRTGGFKKSPCGDGKKEYAFKVADDGRYWLRVSWEGKIVTCFRATWSYLLWHFKQDGCDPPRPPFGHDGMSAAAY
jgi:hypothetical protein